MPKIEEFLRFKDGTESRLVDIPYIDFAADHESADGQTLQVAYERYKRENRMTELSDYVGYDPEKRTVLGAVIIVKVDGKDFKPLL